MITGTHGFRCASSQTLQKTPLFNYHQTIGAKIVPFCGWEMPLQYPAGVRGEIAICRNTSALFDVSHMGQLIITGKDRIPFIERVCVSDIKNQKNDTIKYSIVPGFNGGTIDDMMVTKCADHLYVVINAACFEKDMAHFIREAKRFDDVKIENLYEKNALVAIQGPKAESVVCGLVDSEVAKQIQKMPFMTRLVARVAGVDSCIVSRSGYTGEDGFEISIPRQHVVKWAETVAGQKGVGGFAGLAARDTLRLEAGLSLYGNDLDQDISLVEAGLTWTMNNRTKTEGNFIGAEKILEQIKNGVQRKRVGLIIEGAPAREHALIYHNGIVVGEISSGGPSPTIKKNIAMALLPTELTKIGTELKVDVRGKLEKATVSKMPFFPHRYKK